MDDDERLPGFECRFCDRPDPERIIGSDSGCYVQLSLGPLREGHAMVISDDHYSCSAELPPEENRALWAVTEVVTDVLSATYGPCVVFEHGRSGACLPPGHGEDHCYHAHVHVVPANVAVSKRVANDYPLTRLTDWADLHSRYAAHPEPYLLVGDRDGIQYVGDPQNLPRHYLRSVVAELVGTTELADWVAFPNYGIIQDALARIGDRVEERLSGA
jgi:diadenosine tetraphosphate (Ap4A) HIT family hydrolase